MLLLLPLLPLFPLLVRSNHIVSEVGQCMFKGFSISLLKHCSVLCGGGLLWGERIVIPQSSHNVVLTELHKEHMGVSNMKALAHSHV